jgi:hypothetical protein
MASTPEMIYTAPKKSLLNPMTPTVLKMMDFVESKGVTGYTKR